MRKEFVAELNETEDGRQLGLKEVIQENGVNITKLYMLKGIQL